MSTSESRSVPASAVTPHLVWSASTTSPPRRGDHSLIGLGLQQIRAGQPGSDVHAVGAEKQHVEVQPLQVATVSGPTSAIDGVRCPPVSRIV